jgi:hypothetical protein
LPRTQCYGDLIPNKIVERLSCEQVLGLNPTRSTKKTNLCALCHWCGCVEKKNGDEIILSFILVKQKVKMEELEEESHLQLT